MHILTIFGFARTSDDLEDYHDQARMVPRLVHPFMDVYEVLMFGRAYKGTDMTWDEDDEDDEDDIESEDESEDEDEQGQRTRDRKEARYALAFIFIVCLLKPL